MSPDTAAAAAPPAAATAHPLDPLSGDELRGVVAAARDGLGLEQATVVTAVLREPDRDALEIFEAGGPLPSREADVVLYEIARRLIHEATVAVSGWRLLAHRELPGALPPIGRRELEACADAIKADARWRRAMSDRGVTDVTDVVVQPWPPGQREPEDPPDRRLSKALTFVGTRPGDNIYARPVEGLLVTVDLDTAEVLAVDDTGAVPLPPLSGDYEPEWAGRPGTPVALRSPRTDVRPIEIRQPEGPSFHPRRPRVALAELAAARRLHPA